MPRFQGAFDQVLDPTLGVDLIILERCLPSSASWTVTGGLTREPGGSAAWVAGSQDPQFGDDPAKQVWDYLVDKAGGNAYTYEVAFLRIEAVEDAAAVMTQYEVHLQAQGHPLGRGLSLVGSSARPPESTPPQEANIDTQDSDTSSHSCADHTHLKVPFHIADVLTWRLVAELVRRHPEDLWVLRTHPFGMYDGLAVRRLRSPEAPPSLVFNRLGNHVGTAWFGQVMAVNEVDSSLPCWGDAYAASDPGEWLRDLELLCGLTPPSNGVPPTTPSALAIRWIAHFLSIQLGARQRWTAWTVDDPSSDYDRSFKQLPATAEWLRQQADPQAHLGMWFIGHSETHVPEFAVSRHGDLWSAGGRHARLHAEHRDGASVAALVVRTAGQALPH